MKNIFLALLLAFTLVSCKKEPQRQVVEFEYSATVGAFDLWLYVSRNGETITLQENKNTGSATFKKSFEVQSGDVVHGRAKALKDNQVITSYIRLNNNLLNTSSENYNNTGYFNIEATIP